MLPTRVEPDGCKVACWTVLRICEHSMRRLAQVGPACPAVKRSIRHVPLQPARPPQSIIIAFIDLQARTVRSSIRLPVSRSVGQADDQTNETEPIDRPVRQATTTNNQSTRQATPHQSATRRGARSECGSPAVAGVVHACARARARARVQARVRAPSDACCFEGGLVCGAQRWSARRALNGLIRAATWEPTNGAFFPRTSFRVHACSRRCLVVLTSERVGGALCVGLGAPSQWARLRLMRGARAPLWVPPSMGLD